MSIQAMVEDYLQAFGERDLARCLNYCADTTVVHFQWRTFKGRDAIEQWHKDRFQADLRVLSVDKVAVDGDTATVDATVSSNVLKALRVNSVPGRVTIKAAGDRFVDVRFALR